MRIGVMGGTFDPVHIGHLAAAEEARAQLGLEQVIFVPAGIPPHKMDEEVLPAKHRLAMVKLAISSNSHFTVSRVDIDRPGPSYTVDTIKLLRDELGAETEIYFIMGSDSLMELPTWHEPRQLIHLCRLAVMTRPGYNIDLESLDEVLPGISSRVQFIDMPHLAISSSDLQWRVREGLPIKYQVPQEVEEYIYAYSLYRGRNA